MACLRQAHRERHDPKHGLGFQQIQGGQQIGILDLTALERRYSWLTGAVAGFYFILYKLNLLASLNLLEKMLLVIGVRLTIRDSTPMLVQSMPPALPHLGSIWRNAFRGQSGPMRYPDESIRSEPTTLAASRSSNHDTTTSLPHFNPESDLSEYPKLRAANAPTFRPLFYRRRVLTPFPAQSEGSVV